jgi:predicted nucleic acid-binding protein
VEVIADTTVLIDLWRYRKTPRRLADLTGKVGAAAILVPWITQAEFSRGALFKDVPLAALAEFFTSFHLLPLDQAAMDAYCRLWVGMARTGRAPDYPDLWIAACAVARGVPVLTRNPKHFSHVPELEVIGYEIS